jgi:hypothetical protein
MNNLEVKKEKGTRLKGVFTNKEFNTGEVVLFICCEESTTPTKYTIQVDNNYHILDPIVKEMNHSLDPNVTLSGHSLIATRKIKQGSEVLRNYYETEEIIIEPFTDRETKEVVNTQSLYSYNNKNVEDIYGR